jgi:hypothetical protein
MSPANPFGYLRFSSFIIISLSFVLACFNELSLAIAFWLIGGLSSIVLQIYFRKAGVIHLDLCFSFFLFIYSISVPLSALIRGDNNSLLSLQLPIILCILAFWSFELGTFIARNKRLNLPIKTGNLSLATLSKFSTLGKSICYFSLLFSLVIIILTTGFSSYFSSGYAGRSLLKREYGPIEIGLYIFCVGYFMELTSLWLDPLKKKLNARFMVVIGIGLLFSVYCAFLGIRRPIFLIAVGSIAGLSLVKRKPHLLTFILFSITALVLFGTFAEYRQLLSSEQGLEFALDFIKSNATWEWLDFSESELGAPFKTLTDYLSLKQRFYNIPGSSYLTAPLYLLPRFLSFGITSPSVVYTNQFFDSNFIAIGGNMGFFPVTEAYLNFGELGIFSVFFLIGFILSTLNKWFQDRGATSPFAIVLFMIFTPWIAFFMRLDFSSCLKGLLYSQLVPFLIPFLAASLLKFRYKRG